MPDNGLYFVLIKWFGILLSAGFGNPIPEEILLISGGISTAQMIDEYGLFRWLMLPVCLLGGVGADIVLYSVGRLFGSRLLDSRIMQRVAPIEKRNRIHANLHRYGIIIFVIGRLVPGIRTTLFLTAGTMRLNIFRFVLADGIGAIVGGGMFFMLGYGLGSNFLDLIKHLQEKIHPYQPVLFLFLLSAVVIYLMYNFFRHPISTGDPKEVPLIGTQIAAHMPNRGEEEKAKEHHPGTNGTVSEGVATVTRSNLGS